MKKRIILSFLLMIAMLFAFTACPTSPTTESDDSNESSEGDVVLAAIVDNVENIVKDVLSDEEVAGLSVVWSESPIQTRSLSDGNLYALALFSGYSLGDSSLSIASGSMAFEFSVSSAGSGSYSITGYAASVSSSLSIEGSETASVAVTSITGIKGVVEGATVEISSDGTIGEITVADDVEVTPISSTISAEIEIDGEEIESSTSVSGVDDSSSDTSDSDTGSSDSTSDSDDEEEEYAIYLDTNTMSGVEFGNPEDLVLTTTDNLNYKVVGTLSTMTGEQSAAFWGSADYEGSSYIAFKVRDISSDNPVKVQGWVSSIDSEDYKDQKSGSTATGKNLAITKGATLRSELEGCYIWKCELTDGTTYTVDLTDQASSLSSEYAIYLDTNTMGGVEFGNSSGLSLTTEDGINYKVVGDLSAMSDEQSTAFWGDTQYAGSLYIAFKVRDISSENPVVKQGWVNDVNSIDYKDEKSGSTAKGKNLAITKGVDLRSELDGCYIWKCELTNGSVYTVDLTAQANSLS